MGLIQRAIEASGIATISISVSRAYAVKVKPPRAIFLRWPLGNLLEKSGSTDQQIAVLYNAFDSLYTIQAPGDVIDLNWRWHRENYARQPCRNILGRYWPSFNSTVSMRRASEYVTASVDPI